MEYPETSKTAQVCTYIHQNRFCPKAVQSTVHVVKFGSVKNLRKITIKIGSVKEFRNITTKTGSVKKLRNGRRDTSISFSKC